MNSKWIIGILILFFIAACSLNAASIQKFTQEDGENKMGRKIQEETATFAAGCFWGVEDKFRKVQGVASTMAGYTGGHTKDPDYEEVCTGKTGHAEAVQLTFDPDIVSYEELLDVFFRIHDPTQRYRQGPDGEGQYRSAIFFHNQKQKKAALKKIEKLEKTEYQKEIATEVAPASEFTKAEEYHQCFYEKRRK